MSREAASLTRLPPGHPEGFLEAFANLYSAYAGAIRAARSGERTDSWVATLADGVEGMRLVDAIVRSSQGGGVWTQLL